MSQIADLAPDLATALAGVLVGAAAIGWVGHWLWTKLSGVPRAEQERIDALVEQLHACEEAREATAEARERIETRLAAREAELNQELKDLREGMEARLAAREAELDRALREAKSESETAWDGLASARQRIGDLERALAEAERGG